MERHESCWRKDLAEVTKSSNVSVPEIIQLTKLQMYANNDIFVTVVSRINSVNTANYLKEGADNEELLYPTDDISKKNVCYLSAPQHLGITQNNTEQIT